jgi:prepilin-type processing-associated H-X9-DG protein
MPISFTCPYCGLQTNVGEAYAGQSGPCAGCGKIVTIPPLVGMGPPPRAGGGMSVGAIIIVVLAAALGVVLACGGILAALLLPAVQASREAARRSQCCNNLRQIALAMHNYHDTYKCFPPAVIADKNGRPMRSWRVAILPFLEQSPLHDRYNSNEPWDSPSNRTLGSAMPPTYRCPSEAGAGSMETNYVMIVGKGTAGGLPNEAVSFADITDGTSNTILIVEVTGSGIHWMEPRDLSLEDIARGINDGSGKCISSNHPGGANIALCDGSVRFLSQTIDPVVLRSLILRSDGAVMGPW